MTTGSIRRLAVLCAVAALAIAVPRAADAQAKPASAERKVTGFMNLRFGVDQPTDSTFNNSGEVDYGGGSKDTWVLAPEASQ